MSILLNSANSTSNDARASAYGIGAMRGMLHWASLWDGMAGIVSNNIINWRLVPRPVRK